MRKLYIIVVLFILAIIIWPKAVIGLILIFGVIALGALVLDKPSDDNDDPLYK